ncbi:hypothetical protein [Petrimonas sulfuriphila]|uniref:hypothetical protein n=1 Tax=Petrimonas sulfuriphila TaxID=285070 RepID=UPI003EB99B69
MGEHLFSAREICVKLSGDPNAKYVKITEINVVNEIPGPLLLEDYTKIKALAYQNGTFQEIDL